jgi:16S rRNA (guanine(966)-N(2))-methyltransferase RsmD
MRVIAGSVKGHKLTAPRGMATRPTADRVRQSIFDMLAFRCEPERVLDLFAGSGALGIEALSRGAKRAVFVEKNPEALKAVAENLNKCGFTSAAQVQRSDFRSALRKLGSEGERFDLVFIDPPYEGGVRDEALAGIQPLLQPGALVVVETASTEKAPVAPAGLSLELERKFGRTMVFLYRYGEHRDLSR